MANFEKKLGVQLLKEKRISARNSISARKSRSCEDVNDFLKKLVEVYDGKNVKELWSLIPGERDGSDFYRENDKLHHEGCECRGFGIDAFYKRIAKIKILASDAK